MKGTLLKAGEKPETTPKDLNRDQVNASQKLNRFIPPAQVLMALNSVKPRTVQENNVPELELLRNKYALRLQKGISELIVQHKHARALYLWLELKPLFSSGLIFAEYGKIPYTKIAEFTGEGISTVRKKITRLKKMKLLRIDPARNIQLASYNKLPEVLKLAPERKFRKYKLKNNSGTQFQIKQLAIYENLKRQEYQVFRKIYLLELRDILSRRGDLDKRNSNDFTKCEDYFSAGLLKKIRKQVRDNFDSLKKKYEKIYNARMNQIEFGFPEVNPNVTLSCSGIANVLGRKALSSGFYQMKKLQAKGLLTVVGLYTPIERDSPAVYESFSGFRTDIFGYRYNTRRRENLWPGKVFKYFRNCPNQITPNETTLFF